MPATASATARLRLILLSTLTIGILYLLFGSSSDSVVEQEEPLTQRGKPKGTEPNEVVEVLGIGRHSGSIIFVHGLGGNAQLALPLVAKARKELWQITWVMPNAGFMPVTAQGGRNMSSWFDIEDLHIPLGEPQPDHEDETNMKLAVDRIHQLVEDELARGIDSDRIVIAGFSQGCALTLLAGLSTKHELGGLLCMAGWLPITYKNVKNGRKLTHTLQADRKHRAPIFWGHGDSDDVVHYDWALDGVDMLNRMGYEDVEFHSYPGLGHWYSPAEEEDLLNWLKKRLPPT